MEIRIFRHHDDGESTLGMLMVDDFVCYTLEDSYRERKVKGKTRIPAGEYPVAVRKVSSPLTEKYRGKYDWFKYHLELQNVPNFDYIYFHIGNYAGLDGRDDTEGCILLGYGQNFKPTRMIKNSAWAFEDFYSKVFAEAQKGNLKVKIYDAEIG